MTLGLELSLSLIVIFIGLQLFANSFIKTLFCRYLLCNHPLGKRMLPFLGILMTLTFIPFTLGYLQLGAMINVAIILLFSFFAIQGRSIQKKNQLTQRELLRKEYEEKRKKHQESIQKIKASKKQATRPSASQETRLTIAPDSPMATGQTKFTSKNKVWNDGRLTAQELLEELKASIR